eukprot:8135018-Ditylum_brightwellii.AAC.1
MSAALPYSILAIVRHWKKKVGLYDAVIAPQPLRDVGCDFFRLYYNASCDEVDVVSFGDLTATALRSNILGEVG